MATGVKKAKARLCILGFEKTFYDDYDGKELERSDSPTVNKTTARVAQQIAVSKGWKCRSGDIRTAFLRGNKREQPLYINLPPEIPHEADEVGEVLVDAYGTDTAPRAWYLRCSQDLLKVPQSITSTTSVTAKLHPLDKCCVLYFNKKELIGMCLLHVDDVKVYGGHLFTPWWRRS